ncbi:MAG TPA: serine/threonine-protein kinase [Thermomonospora sp.]|nr:serine/threonine-protein kinase [Thermomonospora sp.]
MTLHTTPNAAALHPDDPRELGPYRLLGRLGRGGMGTVLLGEDPAGRRVAVKVINSELAGEAAFRERFRREVTAARRVRRFCTAPVLDAELDRDPPYVVTEFIEGPSLERAVAERGPLPGSDLEGLAVGVATALTAIHGAGIVHRDLKPANVLLSATGPRVIDFGIARALDAADGPTRTGQFVGTPAYLPPELLRGEPVTPASDVFAWGCVIAYAGTGRAPFTGATVPEILYRVAHEEPRLDGLDPALRELVAAALDKDPRRRPTTGDLLARLVGHERPDPERLAATLQETWPPTLAAPPAGTPGARKAPRRRGLVAGVAGAVVAAVAAGTAAWMLGGPGDGPPSLTATDVLLSDNFNDPQSGWEDNVFEDRYRDGRYALTVSGITETYRGAGAPLPREKTPRSIVAQVRMKIDSAGAQGEGGLYCGAADNSRYELLLRRDGTARVRKVVGERGVELAPPVRTAIDPKAFHRVTGRCEQGEGRMRLTLWVGGKRMVDVTDTNSPLLPTERIGLVANRPTWNHPGVVVFFDDYLLDAGR